MFNRKNKYENIFLWDESGEGTCFYCKEDKPINIKLIGDKGICNDCVSEFKIGNMAADRHAVKALSQGLRSHGEAEKWLVDHGCDLIYRGKSKDIYLYYAVNNRAIFDRYMDRINKSGRISSPDEKEMFSFTTVEISEDGDINIIY